MAVKSDRPLFKVTVREEIGSVFRGDMGTSTTPVEAAMKVIGTHVHRMLEDGWDAQYAKVYEFPVIEPSLVNGANPDSQPLLRVVVGGQD